MTSTVTERFTWEQLKDIVRRGTSGEDVEALGILGRCEADLLVYRAHRAKLLDQYVSLNDYLRIRLFGAPSAVDAESGKLAVAEPDPTTRTRKVLVMANEFPYYCQEGVGHFNIWSSGAPLTDEQVEALISERLPCTDHCWFVNPPQYQSVRTIWHCHVLTLGLRPDARLGRPGEAEPFPEEGEESGEVEKQGVELEQGAADAAEGTLASTPSHPEPPAQAPAAQQP